VYHEIRWVSSHVAKKVVETDEAIRIFNLNIYVFCVDLWSRSCGHAAQHIVPAASLSFPPPLCHSREGRNPARVHRAYAPGGWIPVFAGMTEGSADNGQNQTAESRMKVVA